MSDIGHERPGRVVLLNGPSSAGKTSIARALVALLRPGWFHVPVDAVHAMRSAHALRDDGELHEVLRRTRRGYHRVVAGLASAGNDVVMDYPLSEPWRLDDLLDVLAGHDVLLVDVRCAADELDRREQLRGDRDLGLARSQEVFGHDDRDLVVDTTHASAATCAARIAELIDGPGESAASSRAFERLRLARG